MRVGRSTMEMTFRVSWRRRHCLWGDNGEYAARTGCDISISDAQLRDGPIPHGRHRARVLVEPVYAGGAEYP